MTSTLSEFSSRGGKPALENANAARSGEAAILQLRHQQSAFPSIDHDSAVELSSTHHGAVEGATRVPRLLVVSDTLRPDPNGVALIALHTSEILSHRASVHLFGPAGAEVPESVTYTPVKRSRIGTPDCRLPSPQSRLLAEAVEASDRIVVHTLGPLGCAALFYARRIGKHSTLFLHNDLSMLMRHTVGRRLGRAAAQWTASTIERWAVRRASRVLAPRSLGWSDCEVFRLDPPMVRAHACPVQPVDGPLTIAYHGRVSHEKAVDVTVRAIACADPDHSRFRLRIIGDGSQMTATLNLAEELGVPVEHVPWCDEPTRAIADAHIYVTSSRTETYSIATLEAMSCGLPVIARSVGEISSYLTDGVNGLLFRDDSELAGLLLTAANDPRLREQLSTRAAAAATHRSVWEQFADASDLP